MCLRNQPTQSNPNRQLERQNLHSECHIPVGEFRVVVAEAVELIEEYEMDSFEAADCVATKRNLPDFESYLAAVRSTVTARANAQ